MKPTLIYDTEIYVDYYLCSFLNLETGNVRHFDFWPGVSLDVATIRTILKKYRVVGFNSINFDLPLLTLALNGASCEEIKAACDKIIQGNVKYWQMKIELHPCDHIDIFDVAPGMASLKIYAGRLHAKRMQDLPIEPHAEISSSEPIVVRGVTLTDPVAKRMALREYCGNDLENTALLYRSLEPQIVLREQMGSYYGMDLRSKSDAQIAEAVIRSEVKNRMGRDVAKPTSLEGTTFKYQKPAFVGFDSPRMLAVLDTITEATFEVQPSGAVKLPDVISNLPISLGYSIYRMGIGGLHSSEKSIAHHATDDVVLVDRDVASYYPAIILRCGLAPQQMGEYFRPVYERIVKQRLEAKAAGDTVTADALKITINGSFGKFGSRWSYLYSPNLLIQTTVTGQLCLLMLIEALEMEGIPVVSANTDGIVIACPKKLIPMMNYVVTEWEWVTGFTTEETRYRAVYSRDVNNYIAVKPDGKCKLKGIFAPTGLMKNPTHAIVTTAVVRYLVDGIPIEKTIRECDDIRQFVVIRQVKGGALDKGGNYLGKAVRWYYAAGETGHISYKLNGYKVATSDGARPLMDLPDAIPSDVDHDWYVREAVNTLGLIGAANELEDALC